MSGWTRMRKYFHYRIVSKLGAGGMGEVYLARYEIDRKIALKILAGRCCLTP
jgi:serine/threonine protein kinase